MNKREECWWAFWDQFTLVCVIMCSLWLEDVGELYLPVFILLKCIALITWRYEIIVLVLNYVYFSKLQWSDFCDSTQLGLLAMWQNTSYYALVSSYAKQCINRHLQQLFIGLNVKSTWSRACTNSDCIICFHPLPKFSICHPQKLPRRRTSLVPIIKSGNDWLDHLLLHMEYQSPQLKMGYEEQESQGR